MLGNPTCLAGNYGTFADIIQERSFTVINVTHDSNNRCARHQVFFCILNVCDIHAYLLDGGKLDFSVKFGSDHFNYLGI